MMFTMNAERKTDPQNNGKALGTLASAFIAFLRCEYESVKSILKP